MKKLFENWRRFTERLDGPDNSADVPFSSTYPKITQSEFAEDFHKIGTRADTRMEEDRKSQLKVLSNLFKSLEDAPEENPDWYDSRMPEFDKGESFPSSTILNSIYSASGESEEFVFPNKSVALNFFHSIADAKPPRQQSQQLEVPIGLADTLEAPRRIAPTIVEPRRATRKID